MESLKNETLSLKSELEKVRADYTIQINEKEEKLKQLENTIITTKQQYEATIKQKEDELSTLKNPESNEELLALKQRVQVMSQKNKRIAQQANEKLNAAYKVRDELQAQVANLEKSKEETEKRIQEAVNQKESELNALHQSEIEKKGAQIESEWKTKTRQLEVNLAKFVAQSKAGIVDPQRDESPEVG